MSKEGTPPRRGFTLLELVVALGITGIVAVLAVQAMNGFSRDQALRQKVAGVQGWARVALGTIEKDLRQASLGSSTGVIWTASGGNAVARPAVQIFSGAAGGGTVALNVKPGTDALLVVEWAPPAGSTATPATVGDLSTTTGSIAVTDASQFSPGDAILMGDYADASWGVIQSVQSGVSPPQLTLQDQSANVLPSQQSQRLAAGAFVRRARAHLYYVDASDELVQVTLAAPRAPSSSAEVLGRTVLAQGFENLKIDCQLDNGSGGFGACPAPLSSGDPIASESSAAFGAFQAGHGPLLSSTGIALLRTVIVNVAVRSPLPLPDGQGDPKIPLAGGTLPVGGADDTAAYVRRTYQLVGAIRNTSLGVF